MTVEVIIREVKKISELLGIHPRFIWGPIGVFLNLVVIKELKESFEHTNEVLLILNVLNVDWQKVIPDTCQIKPLIVHSQLYIKENIWLLSQPVQQKTL